MLMVLLVGYFSVVCGFVCCLVWLGARCCDWRIWFAGMVVGWF